MMEDADADEVTALLQLLATVPNVKAAVRAARKAVEAEGGGRSPRPSIAVTRGARSFSGDDEGEKPAAAHERRIEALRRRLLLEDADAPPPPPPLPPSDLKPTTELDLAALGTGAGGGDEADASQRAMAILRETEGASAFERGALVKTIRNDFWHQFARALDRGDLSPCSLPPPGGAGMRLFGRAYSSSCGVVLARKKLHLPSDVWCWPAGFFAKTEFSTGRKKSESLDSSSSSFFVADELRRNAVPLEQLERMAIRKEYVHFGETRASTEVAPYNEVLAPVTREAVVAVFARTTRPDHLLLAMAARDLLAVASDTALPLLVLDAGGGADAVEFTADQQAGLLAKLCEAKPSFCLRPHADVPALRHAPGPLDAQLVAHGAYGLADDVLHALLRSAPAPARAARDALAHAVRADNAEAARAVAGVVGAELSTFAADEACAPGSVRHASDRCLVASGAVAALIACASGALAKRSRDAVALLDAWLEKADQSSGLPPGGVPRRVEDGRRQGGLAPRAATHGLCGRARAGESARLPRPARVAGAERRLGRRRGAREAGRTGGARVVVPPAVAAPRTVAVRARPRGRGGLVGRPARRGAGTRGARRRGDAAAVVLPELEGLTRRPDRGACD